MPSCFEVLNIPPGLLPEVRSSSQVSAETATELWGAAIPIAGLAGDQQAALFGQRCHTPGTVKNTYGTGCFLLMPTGAQAVRSDHRLLTTPAWQFSGQTIYALEGSVFIGGAVVQWLRDGLGMIRASAEVEPLAASVPDTGGVYLVPAFAGLGAPHWDPYARGTLVGLTRGTSAAHIARAALESIAYQSRDVVAAMQADAGLSLTELRVDGGGNGQQSAHAVPGRYSRRPGGPAPGYRDKRPGSRLSGRSGRWLLDGPEPAGRPVAGRADL